MLLLGIMALFASLCVAAPATAACSAAANAGGIVIAAPIAHREAGISAAGAIAVIRRAAEAKYCYYGLTVTSVTRVRPAHQRFEDRSRRLARKWVAWWRGVPRAGMTVRGQPTSEIDAMAGYLVVTDLGNGRFSAVPGLHSGLYIFTTP